MAEDEVKKKFSYLFGENVEDWPHNFGGSFIPLKLEGWPEALCNALFPVQFNKAIIYARAFKPQGQGDTSDTEAAFLDLHLSISNDIVSTKIMINVTTLILKLSISLF